MYSELSDKQKKLSDFMSKISESAYAAQWMHNLEYVLWDVVLNGQRKFGRHLITQFDIDILIQLSTEANCWIYFNEETDEMPIPIDEWKKKFEEYIAIDPNLRDTLL